MSGKIITVTAHMKAKEGQEEDVRAQLAALVAPSRSEPGCILYDLYQCPEDKASFLFYEIWSSRQDLDDHLKKPYIDGFMKKAGEFLAGPPKVSLWENIAEPAPGR